MSSTTYTWFFVSYFIFVLALDEKSYIFDPKDTTLAECIIANFDDTFKSSQIAQDVAYFAAKRFHGKSISCKNFNYRFASFYYELRCRRINHGIERDQLSKRFQAALKLALIACANNSTLKKTNRSAELISFENDRHFLSTCVESNLKLTSRQEFHLKDGFTEFIAGYAARRYRGKTLSRKDFHHRHRYFFKDLREKKISHSIDISKLSAEIELLVEQALLDCAVNKGPFEAVPTFKIEPPGMAHILDLILVKWPNDLYHMIQSRNDRAMLRRYANDALTALISELNVYQNNTKIYRLSLQSFWNKRAQEMFDGNSDESYVVHQYSMNYPILVMLQSDFEKFINRKCRSFSDRNPLVPRSSLNKILNIHRSVPLTIKSKKEVDIFDDYIFNGMTSAEYYFENQLNQSYRIIFFFLELQARGICTDDGDIFDGPFPHDFVPEYVQAIVYDDDAYRDYLLNKRLFFKSCNIQNDIAQNIFKNARVLEENLTLLMSNVPSTSGVQLENKTATTVSVISTTTQSVKRKDDIWKNENGKCFPKRSKMAAVSNNCCIHKNLITENLNEVTSSTPKVSSNYLVSDVTGKDFSLCRFEIDALLKREKLKPTTFMDT